MGFHHFSIPAVNTLHAPPLKALASFNKGLDQPSAVPIPGHKVTMERLRELRIRAERYRRLATTISDPQALQALHELAACYEALAAQPEEAPPSSSGSTGRS